MLNIHRWQNALHLGLHGQTRNLSIIPYRTPTYVKKWIPSLREPVPYNADKVKERIAQKAARDAIVNPLVKYNDHLRFRYIGLESQMQRKERIRVVMRLVHFVRIALSSAPVFTSRYQRPLWNAYRTLKAMDSQLLKHVSNQTWHALWLTQCEGHLSSKTSQQKIKQLYHDMRSVRKAVTVNQRAVFLECIFIGGRKGNALGRWEKDHKNSIYMHKDKHMAEHLEIGAKLHALAGNIDRAYEITKLLLRDYPTWSTNVALIVFRAMMRTESAAHNFMGGLLYHDVRQRQGFELSLQNYDAWLIGFLEVPDHFNATHVLHDMIATGCLGSAGPSKDAQNILTRLHMIYQVCEDIETKLHTAKTAISGLPGAYHGLVYSDFLNAVVIDREPEIAVQIVNHMLESEFKPETIHFNHLLQALFRSNDSPKVLKAENIGWQMVSQASRPLTPSKAGYYSSSMNTDQARKIPPADVTTYALMMQHHGERRQWEHVDYLSRQFKESSNPLNIAMLNALMENKCRQGAFVEAFQLYRTRSNPLVDTDGLFPNGATFRCLWKILRFSLGDPATHYDPSLPSPRKLLAEMMSWHSLIYRRYDFSRFVHGLGGNKGTAIVALVLHCFSYVRDLPGSLVALNVLYHKFKVSPGFKAPVILRRQIAWVDMSRPSEREYYRALSNKEYGARLEAVYDTLRKRRYDQLREDNIFEEDLTLEEAGEIDVNLLSEFIRVVLKRTYPPQKIEHMIREAKHTINVPDLPTGDMNAFEVP